MQNTIERSTTSVLTRQTDYDSVFVEHMFVDQGSHFLQLLKNYEWVLYMQNSHRHLTVGLINIPMFWNIIFRSQTPGPLYSGPARDCSKFAAAVAQN